MFSSVIVLSTFVLSIVLYVIFLKYCYVPGLLISECHSWHDFTTSHFTPRMKSPKTSEQAHQMNIQVTFKVMFGYIQVPSPLTDILPVLYQFLHTKQEGHTMYTAYLCTEVPLSITVSL